MCATYDLSRGEIADELQKIIDEINHRYKDRPETPQMKTSGEVRITDIVPVIAPKGSAPMRFGLPSRVHPCHFNTRREEVFDRVIRNGAEVYEKEYFAEPLLRSRIAIPTVGFHEWTQILVTNKNGKQDKIPVDMMRFTLPDEEVTYLAGFYNMCVPKGATAKTPCFSILTTDANSSVNDYHPRMPLRIPKELIPEWLADPNYIDTIFNLQQPLYYSSFVRKSKEIEKMAESAAKRAEKDARKANPDPSQINLFS